MLFTVAFFGSCLDPMPALLVSGVVSPWAARQSEQRVQLGGGGPWGVSGGGRYALPPTSPAALTFLLAWFKVYHETPCGVLSVSRCVVCLWVMGEEGPMTFPTTRAVCCLKKSHLKCV